MGASTPLVGRAEQLERLLDIAERAGAGTPRVVLVHGEAGVGKTRLVREAVSKLDAEGWHALWGRAVRFATEVASFFPISQALGSRWEPHRTGSGTALERVAAEIGMLVDSGPSALVIDDLQWADLSSLDSLTYLVGGFTPGQRLLIVGTYRDTDLGDAHRLRAWLADVRRMPGVVSLPVTRLSRQDTEDLVRGILANDATPALASRVFERTGGNAYFTELLARAVEPGTHRLPETLPTDLRDALLGAWHRLSAHSREVMNVLAVGGSPLHEEALRRVTTTLGMDPEKVLIGVTESREAGLTRHDPHGVLWFHHPMVPEALVTELVPSEAARMHAAYADMWLAESTAPERVRAAQLAEHLDGAGDPSGALEWSLRAATEAERVQGYAEESVHLARACDLWPRGHPRGRGSAGEHAALLARATRAAHRAGDFDLALSLARRAYDVTIDDGEPLAASGALNELNWVRMQHGEDPPEAALREAVDLSRSQPAAPEHARALAQLSWFEQWKGLATATSRAGEALERARACGSRETLVFTLCVAANALGGAPEAVTLADEGLALARSAGLTAMLEYGAVVRANCLQAQGRAIEAGPFLADTYAELRRSVAPHAAGGIAVYAAIQLTNFGDWAAARALLQEAMSFRMSSYWMRTARLTSAMLLARSGQVTEARFQLDRAQETPGPAGVESMLVSAMVEVLDAEGRFPELAAMLMSELKSLSVVDPVCADELVVRAAQAAQHEVERHPHHRAHVLATINQLRDFRSSADPGLFVLRASSDMYAPALRALFDAHCCALGAELGDEIELWERAVSAAAAASLIWEAADARRRLAIALIRARKPRHRARDTLREARREALVLGAEPLRRDIDDLARQAHLDLADAAVPTPPAIPTTVGLTARELDVLTHLMTGDTYAEIANTLFISQKTVSVHVSNILRKTGTSSRVELAALVRQWDADGGRSQLAPEA